ncbi:hypothetical protein PUMCH_003137 [Australozyma saopauloensis]|uniref:Uncharacterized protein n=1 Tax=Australozyma saopauloensis TaxID=291208 RepID=A0AAX4HBU3_9ASCO|nr:hypothetical protein PUMCH_003137 [[Candida] saopauloensis]
MLRLHFFIKRTSLRYAPHTNLVNSIRPLQSRRFSVSYRRFQEDTTSSTKLPNPQEPHKAEIVPGTININQSSQTQTQTPSLSAGDGSVNSEQSPDKPPVTTTSDPSLGELSKDKDASVDQDDEAHKDEFLTTIFEEMEPYIDTYAVYKRLIDAGFTPPQSDEVIQLLIAQLNTKLSKLLTKYSQIYELENEQYLFESAQQELGVDITRNRENHINEAINLINELERNYTVLSDELNNLLIEMKNDTQIAINDQKSENTLMSKRIMLRIQETNHKITNEITMAMRSEIESLRWHLSRWGVISILTCVITAFVGFYMYRARLKKRLASAKTEFAPLLIYEPSELDDDDYHADLDPDSV